MLDHVFGEDLVGGEENLPEALLVIGVGVQGLCEEGHEFGSCLGDLFED